MTTRFRVFSTLASLAIVVGACSTSGTPAPSTGGGASNPPASTGTDASQPAPASQAATLTGTLTIWEAYGASGSSEKDAFDKIVGQVKAANPGLNVTVTDVPFNDLF